MGWHEAAMLALIFLKLFPRGFISFIVFHTSKRLTAIGKIYNLDGRNPAFATQPFTGCRVNT